jgi:MFS family permease
VTTDLRREPVRPDIVVPRPRGAHAAVRQGRPREAPAEPGAARTRRLRSAAADVAAVGIVAVVVPLALLQLPDAIADAIPPQFASAGTETELLRVAGLALTAMVIAVPLGALAVRRFRAWPVLMAGLGIVGIADLLGNTARTVGQIGIDRALHGCGAGIALGAATALVAERRNLAGRALAGWWAACTVTGLAAAPEVMRHRLASGDWHAALQPYPWLTGAALALTALYALLADGTVTRATRTSFPVAERSQLALLAVPVTGMCVVAVAVTFGHSQSVSAAAVAEAVSLTGLVLMTMRASGAAWFAMMCAVTGFTLAPAAGAVTDLLRAANGPAPGGVSLGGPVVCALALCGAAVCGAVIALVTNARLAMACGLSLAAAGFAVAALTARHLGAENLVVGEHLVLICVLVAGGLSAALAAVLRGARAPGALCGVVLLLAGVLAGYLADGALELQAIVAANRTAAGVQSALTTADARWNILAATLVGGVALVLFWRLFRAATSTVSDAKVQDMAGAPVREAGRTPDHG